MKKISNIILDYGNVIFDIDFNKAQQAFKGLGINNVEGFFSHSSQSDLFDEFDKGIINASAFRVKIREITGLPDLRDQQIDDAWNALLIGVPKGRHDVLLRLKEKYRLFLLSNNNEIHYEWIIRHLKSEYGLPDNTVFFEKDYYSHLMGMRKPDQEIFEYVLKTHGLAPEETLFIDDSPQHLETAKALGLATVLATADRPLEKIVQEEGLLVS